MDGLDAEAYDRTYKDSDLVRRIAAYFKPEGGRIAAAAVAIVAQSILRTLIPIFISQSIDRLAGGVSAFHDVLIMAGVLIGLGVTEWMFNWVRRWMSAEAVGNVVLALRRAAFEAVLERDMSFYDEFPSAKIVSRVTSDTETYSTVVSLVIDLISQTLQVLILVVYLFTIDLPLTLLLLAVTPFIVGAALAFRRIARDAVTQSRRVRAEIGAHIQETISGIGVAKTFRQEGAIYREFEETNQRSFWITLRSGYIFSLIFPVLNILAGISTGSLVYFGGLRVQAGGLSAGNWYLFVQAVGLYWFPLTSIASFWSQFQLGLAAAERVFALLDAEPKVVQIDSKILPDLTGDIQFEHMDFRYKEDEPVLENFSLHIPAGQVLALVGHTGSGKSSLAKLIARFYEFQGGRLLIDGHDIRALDLRAYRGRLGMVTQQPFLFDGSVRDNIRYAKPAAPDAAVEAAAKRVGAGDWLASLPEGLDTPVGERGGSLSMGQRQLVALARVLVEDPAIFILDEATASVDPLTETLIQEGLDEVIKGRTSIVIAHRLSTIRHADRIIVLRQGKIIEEGTHTGLLAQNGHYAELYNTYFRHQSLEYIESIKELVE
jgi:ABC-type multidrug transport system fused ATPase/permease subunit